ncbi:hypothetical protein [Streptosporangium sp. KLBMP 9127]|nr:hypothetical protein [Streptosporangium sp. KLBMP 9127]
MTGVSARRHYFATLLIHLGAIGEDDSPSATLNTYVGEWPEAQEKTRALVDGALGRVPRMCPPGLLMR